MGKRNIGKLFLIIGIVLLGGGVSLFIICNFNIYLTMPLICSTEIILALIILGSIYIVIGGLIWNKNKNNS